MEIEIKTEISNEDEEAAIKNTPHDIINTENQNTEHEYLGSSLIKAKQQKATATEENREKLKFPSNKQHKPKLSTKNFINNDTQHREQQQQYQEQIKGLPQLHYYNLKRSATTPIIQESSRRNFHIPGTRCGEIFVANNARKWTFACTFCNKYTRDIGDFILHLKKRHLNGNIDENEDDEHNLQTDSEQSMDAGDDTCTRPNYNSATEQDVSKIYGQENIKQETINSYNNNFYNNNKKQNNNNNNDQNINKSSIITINENSQNSFNISQDPAITPTNCAYGRKNNKALTLLSKNCINIESTFITNAAKTNNCTGTTEVSLLSVGCLPACLSDKIYFLYVVFVLQFSTGFLSPDVSPLNHYFRSIFRY